MGRAERLLVFQNPPKVLPKKLKFHLQPRLTSQDMCFRVVECPFETRKKQLGGRTKPVQ